MQPSQNSCLSYFSNKEKKWGNCKAKIHSTRVETSFKCTSFSWKKKSKRRYSFQQDGIESRKVYRNQHSSIS